MKKRPQHSLRPNRGAGTALVLTLFFILLISALVVALLTSMRLDRSSTQGYYQSARVQELANGALEDILSDLKSEIDAGSRTNAVYTTNGIRIYVPITNRAAQPARIGFAPGTNGDYSPDVDTGNVKLPPTLLRVSRANPDTNTIFPPGIYDPAKLPPQRAAAVSTTNYSENGRTISPKRWNTSYLLSGTVSPPSRFATNAPDWIYITRGGSRAVADADVPQLKTSDNLDNTNFVVGRYAYVVYDSGGLIDINAAGFPSLVAQTNAAVRGKSSVVFATLTALPGLSNPALLDDLIKWRSGGSVGAFSATNFLKASTNWTQHGLLAATNGDNPFLSRKDLIDYFSKKVGTGPLPYLGTFSRSLAAPSSRPKTPWTDLNNNNIQDPGELSTIDYDNIADQPTAVNRDFANARFSQDATVSHYADDASPSTYQVQAGDNLVQSRFSLARLDWLKDGNPDSGEGPATDMATAIKSCFGLVWDHPGGVAGTSANGGNKCWNYVSATGSLNNPPGEIKTLEQVAAEGREPDFFELLKAAILSGSLGKNAGPAAFNNGANVVLGDNDFNYRNADEYTTPNMKMGPLGFYAHTFGPYSSVRVPARIPDMQIFKIGANIIDQFDADSYPTAIYFKYSGVGQNDPAGGTSALPVFGPVTMAYGTENLPYIAWVRQLNGSLSRPTSADPSPGSDLTVNTISGWLQPFIWNPHQSPTQTPAGRPSNFEIRAYGSVKMAWNYDPNPAESPYNLKPYPNGTSSIVNYFQDNSNSEVCPAGSISFTDNPSTSEFYAKPYPLLEGSVSNPSVPAGLPPELATSSDANMAFRNNSMSTYGVQNRFVAFSTGRTPATDQGGTLRPFYVLDRGTPGVVSGTWNGEASISNRPDSATPAITYAVGWKDSSGNFHPYSYMTGAFGWTGAKLSQAPGYPNRKVGSAEPSQLNADTWMLADPRTERLSVAFGFWGGFDDYITVYRSNGNRAGPMGNPLPSAGFSGTMHNTAYRYAPGDYQMNVTGTTCYYRDPDGIVRPGDGLYATPATGDGTMTFITTGASATPVGDNTVARHGRRPVVLNRPFQSVAELGYVFRDQPFKSLDFFSTKSADTALLDVFSLYDIATVAAGKLVPLTAGRMNLNASPATAISALLRGGGKKESDAAYSLTSEANAIALNVAQGTMATNGIIDGPQALAAALTQAMRNGTTFAPDRANKTYLEGPIRALSETSDFRTWNLLIDVIAQSGILSPKATTLKDFVVQGECRIWLHVSIDRYTGKVIARQFEPVYE